MYSEDYDRKGFPILNLIFKILIIFIIVLFLILFLPKLLGPNLKNSSSNNANVNSGSNSNSKKNSSSKKCSSGSSSCDLKEVKAISSQIYGSNIEKMKEAAINYYTNERLPKEVGESEKLTLSDMIGKKIIVPLVDKNNKACDVEGSYVKITKSDDEYLLKVNLKDSEKDDYILVHLGCYSYCKSDVCEKNTVVKNTNDNYNVPVKGSKDNSVVIIKKNSGSTAPSNPTVVTRTYSCENVNGSYYDKDGNVVSESVFIKSCEAPKCRIVSGYYFGKSGDVVTKYTYEKECVNPSPAKKTYKCEYHDGKYYDKNGKTVNEVNYIISCKTPKCEKVNGYYFGKYGKVVTEKQFEEECIIKPEPKTYICEYHDGKYYDRDGNVVSKKVYEDECISKPKTYKCEYHNGKYYDKDGKAVSEVNYIISCKAPKCEKVNGYYFGKKGNQVSKETYEKECTTPPKTYKCEYHDGKYYDKDGKAVSEVNYIISCKAPKCDKVNGYYFGKKGNQVSKETYEKECTTEPEYLYEYSKTTPDSLTDWTSWTSWEKSDCSTKEINCSDSSLSCLNKLQMLKRKEKIGTYQKSYARTRQVVKQTGSYTKKACSKYNYVEINKTIYATTTTYTTVNTITSSTKGNSGSWSYNGRKSYSNPPKDTNNTHFVFAGADYSYCGETCTTLPNYYYDSYSLSGSLTNVKSTTTPGSSTTSSSTTTSHEASCGEYVYKTIPIYSTITVTDKDYRTEPLYGDVCYKSTKSRSVISGKTDVKWSTYEDRSLLDDGWIYTGNKKVK